MTVVINGEPRELLEPIPLPDLLQQLGLPPRGLLIEHNGTALRPSEWPSTPVTDGDRLEIIRLVAGG